MLTGRSKVAPLEHRSGCPINLALEVFGDRWSLIIIRDIIFRNRRHFRTLLTQSDEGIVASILADRLRRLCDAKLIVRSEDPTHKQKAIYSLTESAIGLLPILISIASWGTEHFSVSKVQADRVAALEHGGSDLLRNFMTDLRRIHVHANRPADLREGRRNRVYAAALVQGRRQRLNRLKAD